jgi:hypothetical protein
MGLHDDHDVLGQPVLRTWDLTSNSTRYDKMVAAPSDHDLFVVYGQHGHPLRP